MVEIKNNFVKGRIWGRFYFSALQGAISWRMFLSCFNIIYVNYVYPQSRQGDNDSVAYCILV